MTILTSCTDCSPFALSVPAYKHVSETKVRMQINNGLEAVTKQIERWIKAMKENVKLKEDNKELKSTIRTMQRTIDRLERELYYQKQPEEPVIEKPKPKPVPEEPRYSPYAIPVNDELHQKLTQQLSSLAIPNDVITILRRQGIYTVFDLVSLSKSDYEDIYGLSVSGEAKLKSCITDMGLKLFMPVYWNKERKKYMM